MLSHLALCACRIWTVLQGLPHCEKTSKLANKLNVNQGGAVEESKSVKMTVDVPVDFKRDLKTYAAMADQKQKDIIVTAVREYMERNPA